MDERLTDLERRLEELVPRGLGERGRERLEDTIDRLAEEAGPRAAPSKLRWWLGGLGAAAAVAALVAISNFPDRPGPQLAAAANELPLDGGVDPLQTVELVQHVEERFDGGYVLGGGSDAPHRYWGYAVKETEEIFDTESGFTVTVSSEREEGVLAKLTTY